MFIEVAHAAEEAAHAVTAEPGLLGTFGVNWKQLLAHLFNFAILMFVLNRWVYKPLLKVIDERKQKIERGVADAVDAEKRLAEAKNKETELIMHARHEAKDIVLISKKEGEIEKAKRIQQSKGAIDEMEKDSRLELARESDAAKTAIRQELAGLVGDATSKVTSGTIDEKKQHELIQKAIAELSASS